MQYLSSKHFQNRAGLIWSFSKVQALSIRKHLVRWLWNL